MLGWAFGDPLLLRQKGAKPSVPAKLAGCRTLFGCWAGAGAGFLFNTGLPRTIAGTFPVVDDVKDQGFSKAKADWCGLSVVEAFVLRVLGWAFGDLLLFWQK
jgi:hypothetical protein